MGSVTVGPTATHSSLAKPAPRSKCEAYLKAHSKDNLLDGPLWHANMPLSPQITRQTAPLEAGYLPEKKQMLALPTCDRTTPHEIQREW